MKNSKKVLINLFGGTILSMPKKDYDLFVESLKNCSFWDYENKQWKSDMPIWLKEEIKS